MMPFGTSAEYLKGKRESQFIFERIIRPAVLDVVHNMMGPDQLSNFEVIRELDDVSPGSITESIIRHIARADICIVDLTGKNPNVFFELGVRYVLQRNGTILMVQNTSDMPFNIRQFRVVEYDPYFENIDKAKDDLKAAIATSLKALKTPKPPPPDSLVYQAIPDLQVVQRDMWQTETTISWYEYWSRVELVEDMLREVSGSGAYEPHILVGISNGGLLIADSLLRLVYGNKTPLISLWAARHKKEFFRNVVNDSLITSKNVEELVRQTSEEWNNGDEIRILIIDDIVGTQTTINDLLEYLQDRLLQFWKQIDLKFLFLYTPHSKTLTELKEYLFWEDKRVPKKYQTAFESEVITQKIALPYRKSIHSGSVMESNTKTLANKSLKRDAAKRRRAS